MRPSVAIAESDEAWLPIDLAVYATGAPAGTIRGWASIGRVATIREDGRTLYCLADLNRANATRRARNTGQNRSVL